MALIVGFTDKDGKKIGVRVGSDDEAFVRKLVQSQNPGCTISEIKPEEAPTDGPVKVETFAESKRWADVEKAKERANVKEQITSDVNAAREAMNHGG